MSRDGVRDTKCNIRKEQMQSVTERKGRQKGIENIEIRKEIKSFGSRAVSESREKDRGNR